MKRFSSKWKSGQENNIFTTACVFLFVFKPAFHLSKTSLLAMECNTVLKIRSCFLFTTACFWRTNVNRVEKQCSGSRLEPDWKTAENKCLLMQWRWTEELGWIRANSHLAHHLCFWQWPAMCLQDAWKQNTKATASLIVCPQLLVFRIRPPPNRMLLCHRWEICHLWTWR